jgi:hypothetical protein
MGNSTPEISPLLDEDQGKFSLKSPQNREFYLTQDVIVIKIT